MRRCGDDASGSASVNDGTTRSYTGAARTFCTSIHLNERLSDFWRRKVHLGDCFVENCDSCCHAGLFVASLGWQFLRTRSPTLEQPPCPHASQRASGNQVQLSTFVPSRRLKPKPRVTHRASAPAFRARGGGGGGGEAGDLPKPYLVGVITPWNIRDRGSHLLASLMMSSTTGTRPSLKKYLDHAPGAPQTSAKTSRPSNSSGFPTSSRLRMITPPSPCNDPAAPG